MHRDCSAFGVVDLEASGTSASTPRQTIRVSSAYCRTAQVPSSWIGCRTPPSVLIRVCSSSATNRKRYGDVGSPCRRPRLHWIPVEAGDVELPQGRCGRAQHASVVCSQCVHFFLVRVNHHTIDLNATDGVAPESLRRVCMEELRVGITFADGSLLPALAPESRSLLDRQAKPILAHGPHL